MAAATNNPELPDAEKIDHVRGQVHGLYSFFLAIMETHLDLMLLQRSWVGNSEYQEADSLPSPVSEAFRRGQDETRVRLTALLEVAKNRRSRS